MERGGRSGTSLHVTCSLSHLLFQIPTSSPEQLVRGTVVFEAQIISDYKAIGGERVFPFHKWIWL